MADEFMNGYLVGNDNRGGSNGMFGDGWWGIIILAMIFGWGNGGLGFGGMGGGSGLQGMATRADINEGFALNNITGGIQAIQQGICDSTYALNNTITGGFHGIERQLCDVGYRMQDCCCQTQRAIDSVNFNSAQNTCAIQNTIQNTTRDVIEANNANTRSIMDFLVQEKLSAKDAQIAQLQNRVAISEQNALIGARIDAATAELLRRTGHDCPTAAYIVQPPTPVNFPVNGCGTVQWGGNGNGCGGCNYAVA